MLQSINIKQGLIDKIWNFDLKFELIYFICSHYLKIFFFIIRYTSNLRSFKIKKWGLFISRFLLLRSIFFIFFICNYSLFAYKLSLLFSSSRLRPGHTESRSKEIELFSCNDCNYHALFQRQSTSMRQMLKLHRNLKTNLAGNK